ncbi:MmcQ/YjbR family DNA-binding protein [Aeromicrobium sp. Leaf350]|uniref:MmcQ/YjbR family DNA-binding protein n=1 Tax=Aeromicrobium sp. Leaf350 TaxID=2876565 RepID=UPI001E6079F5|nr:MmcQ/YjbR family DNA-binding protein [Aeromicrobium sp. Leaf350]
MARSEVPPEWVERIDGVLSAFPECRRERAWTGTRWRVRSSTVAHVFGGEDGLLRITFRADPDEVAAFVHLGGPRFRVGSWGSDAVGLVLDEATDLTELGELLTDSYCRQAPEVLAAQVERPGE